MFFSIQFSLNWLKLLKYVNFLRISSICCDVGSRTIFGHVLVQHPSIFRSLVDSRSICAWHHTHFNSCHFPNNIRRSSHLRGCERVRKIEMNMLRTVFHILINSHRWQRWACLFDRSIDRRRYVLDGMGRCDIWTNFIVLSCGDIQLNDKCSQRYTVHTKCTVTIDRCAAQICSCLLPCNVYVCLLYFRNQNNEFRTA